MASRKHYSPSRRTSTTVASVQVIASTALFMLFVSVGSRADDQKMSQRQPVVLLHGLARSASSMEKMASALTVAGFEPCNISYPSTKHTIEDLTTNFVLPKIQACVGLYPGPVHFVTHSMGGIVVRYLAKHHAAFKYGRVVMISPPNQGSEVVDTLGELWLFEWINGPAGKQLGTTPGSLPNQLGPAPFEFGIITGDRSINLILSLMIDGNNDGKVSIERAKLKGMADFSIVHATHPFIMKNKDVIGQTIRFLRRGRFHIQ